MLDSFWIWVGFNAFILALVLTDLFFIRKSTTISIGRAFAISSFWVGLAFVFNCGIYIFLGREIALNFLAAYLIEESLSIDNLFVFVLIFQYFQTPKQYQHKVLFWGILGAVAMRALFIIFGILLIRSFDWVLYIFGIFLIYASIKMAFSKKAEFQPKNQGILILIKKWIPVTANYEGDRFFTKHANQWYATPLFVVLLSVEFADLIFALDSIPAVIGISRDSFIIYTSNVFAILGLRSLYFALEGVIAKFHLLPYGLAIILAFIGLKMMLEPFLKVPIGTSLGFIFIVFLSTIVASFCYPIAKRTR